MATNVPFDCGTLPTWVVADCCQACHSGSDVRPVRARFPVGYPPNAETLLAAVESQYVLCCRAQFHAQYAMNAVTYMIADSLDLIPVIPVPDPIAQPAR